MFIIFKKILARELKYLKRDLEISFAEKAVELKKEEERLKAWDYSLKLNDSRNTEKDFYHSLHKKIEELNLKLFEEYCKRYYIMSGKL